MVKINYIHEAFFKSELDTGLRNLIILHPNGQRNIPQNQASTYLNIAQNVLSILKTEE